MRLHEFDYPIQELSYTDPGIRKHLTGLGYKPAGEGGDQTTWKAPDGSILKIFGTQEGQQGMTADHRMFSFWADYCKKHANNPYIPHYGGWTEFEFPQGSGQTYLQIKMEKLTPIRDKTTQAVLDQFDWTLTQGRTLDALKTTVTNKLGPKFVASSPLFTSPVFWKTISEIFAIGNKHGWGLDLHADNYMMRGNQIVIVDPWVASS
jgi:hypothetical protein